MPRMIEELEVLIMKKKATTINQEELEILIIIEANNH